jgi:hypothetical protein
MRKSNRQKKRSTFFLLRGRQAHFSVCFWEEGHHELAGQVIEIEASQLVAMNPPNSSSFNQRLFRDFKLPLLRKKVLIDIKDAFAPQLEKCDIYID